MDRWPAIIAASAAILGTAVGASVSILSSWLERRSRRTLLLIDKLEQLTAANCDTSDWILELYKCTTIQQAFSLAISPASARLQALALMYFPRLRSPVAAYANELKSYYCWAIGCIRDEVQQSLGTQLRAFHGATANEKSDRLMQVRAALVSAIEQEARRLLGHERSGGLSA